MGLQSYSRRLCNSAINQRPLGLGLPISSSDDFVAGDGLYENSQLSQTMVGARCSEGPLASADISMRSLRASLQQNPEKHAPAVSRQSGRFPQSMQLVPRPLQSMCESLSSVPGLEVPIRQPRSVAAALHSGSSRSRRSQIDASEPPSLNPKHMGFVSPDHRDRSPPDCSQSSSTRPRSRRAGSRSCLLRSREQNS